MRIVMTGGTAGIGLVAARHWLAAGSDLTIGARAPGVAPADLRRAATFHPLDLADLETVRSFAGQLEGEAAIDVLILNAGLQNVTGGRSAQGLEITFAANHLAHYLLARRLVSKMAQGGRIVLTASGTHDPEEKTGMPPPRHADAQRLARPETDPDLDPKAGMAGRRAYSTSKLCNVMTARELAKRTAGTRPDLSIMAFDPGFTPGTGLARDYPGAASWVFRHILPLVVRGERVSTPANSGALLAGMAAGADYAGSRGGYFAVRGKALREVPPSTLARDDGACARLWEDSEAILAEVLPGGWLDSRRP